MITSITIKKYISILFLVSLLTLISYAQFGFPKTGIDDANIFFSYAKHLSNGQGFIFSTGGERVEGFTSLLWVLVCAAAFKATGSPEQLLILFNIIIMSVGLTIIVNYIDLRIIDDREDKTTEEEFQYWVFYTCQSSSRFRLFSSGRFFL